MRRCRVCTLPETFPGAILDAQDMCEYCRHAPSPERSKAERAALQQRFAELVERVKGRQRYDCVVSWSGGKDSTYVLALLRQEYGLRVLAFTLDNGFVSPRAMDNYRVVADRLGVDHVIVAPRFDLLRRLFAAGLDGREFPRAALKRASGICNVCMGLGKLLAVQLAQEKQIPLLAHGWSPGQIPLASALLTYTPALVRTMIQSTAGPLERLAGEDLSAYLPWEQKNDGPLTELYNVSPLAFWGYDEKRIREHIGGLGWRAPQDTDPNSSNCLLNAFAGQVHQEQFGYHPYDMELAGLVRGGYLSREEALQRLEEAPDADLLAATREKLGLG